MSDYANESNQYFASESDADDGRD